MNIINKVIEKYRSLSMAVKAGLWFTICNFLQRGISLLTVPIFTRILTTDQYGVYSVYLSWLNILSIFTCLNVYYGVFNKAMVKYPSDRDRYVSSMQGLVVCLNAAYFLVYLLFKDVLNGFFELSTPIMCMMFIEMLMTPMLQFWMGKRRFEYRYKSVVFVSLIKCIINPFLGIAIVLVFNTGAEGRIFATVLIETIICGYIMISQFRKGKKFYHKDYWKYAVLFNLPLIPHYLSGSVLNQGDRIVIQKILGSSFVALYSVAYNVAMLSQLITTAIAQALTPWLYECLRKEKYSDINKTLRPIMVLVAAICFLLMLFAPEIVWVFASSEYSEAVYIIPPIAASVFFIYMYNVYSNFEFYFEKRIFITIASFIAAGLNILLNLIFVPIYGYVAAGYTTLVCYVAYAYAHYLFSLRICKREIKNIRIFDITDFSIISITVCVFAGVTSFLYRYTVLRYSCVAVLCLGLLLCRNRIMKLIRGMKMR